MSIHSHRTFSDVDSSPLAAGPALGANPGRVRSLDVFRGMAIAGMILANNPGDGHVYWPLEHSAWNGCTPTDLVFPFFLFIVGVAIPFSLASRRRKLAAAGWIGSRQTGAILARAARRAVVLFGLGLLLYALPVNIQKGSTGRGILELQAIRIPGVLPRIAACYLAAVLFTVFLPWRARAVIVAALLIGYTLLMRLVPVPGFGPGVLTADGSLASYLDRLVLGRHTYKHNYDPEGMLSTLPAIATTLIGVFAGQWLGAVRSMQEKAAGLLAFGVIGAVLGFVTDGLLLPINKALWTGSFVLYTGGLALLGFGLCYWIVDVHSRERWAVPFKILGMNAITVYVISGLLGRLTLLIKLPKAGGKSVYLKTWLFEHSFGLLTRAPIHASPYNASLMWGLGYVLVFLLLAIWMYRRGMFLKA